LQQSLQRTRQRRPDLMEGMTLDSEQQSLLDELVNDILVDEAKN
jgi:tRNA G37 N-methylase TrmD